MRTWLKRIGIVGTSSAVLGCAGGPTAPSSSTLPSPASFAGPYVLTFHIDEGCTAFPESLRIWTYDAILEHGGHPSLSVHVAGRVFSEPAYVGELYMQSQLSRHDNSRFRFSFNLHYEFLDRPLDPGLQELGLYAFGQARENESGMSGTLEGEASLTGRTQIRCYGSHRFTFVRHVGTPS